MELIGLVVFVGLIVILPIVLLLITLAYSVVSLAARYRARGSSSNALQGEHYERIASRWATAAIWALAVKALALSFYLLTK